MQLVRLEKKMASQENDSLQKSRPAFSVFENFLSPMAVETVREILRELGEERSERLALTYTDELMEKLILIDEEQGEYLIRDIPMISYPELERVFQYLGYEKDEEGFFRKR